MNQDISSTFSLPDANREGLRYVLCFLTRRGRVLMLHRLNPPNAGLWNGVGGHIEPGEDPHHACLREVREETGYRLQKCRFRGILTWDGFETPPGEIYLYTAAVPPSARPASCGLDHEGRLEWKPVEWVCSSAEVVSNIHHFLLPVLAKSPAQHYHFRYQGGEIIGFEIHSLTAGSYE
ncbi:MAG TPA: NUDIX domain-containing protein [Anaerolineaceae bacterium]